MNGSPDEFAMRRGVLIAVGGLPLLGCAQEFESIFTRGSAMKSPLNAERIHSVGPDIVDDEPNATWINEPAGVRRPGPYPLREPDRMQIGSGFPRDLPTPVLQFDRPAGGQPPCDAYDLGFIWGVSAPLKSALFALDPDGFDAVEAETRFPDGSVGPPYWLMELVRFCECLDEERSLAAGARVSGPKKVIDFDLTNCERTFFSAAALGNAQFFRVPQHRLTVLCTDRAKLAIESAGATKLGFRAVGWLV